MLKYLFSHLAPYYFLFLVLVQILVQIFINVIQHGYVGIPTLFLKLLVLAVGDKPAIYNFPTGGCIINPRNFGWEGPSPIFFFHLAMTASPFVNTGRHGLEKSEEKKSQMKK